MFKRIFPLFSCILFGTVLIAQEGTLAGRVTDARTKEKLGGVSIYLDGKGIAVSDTGGNYFIKCAAGEHKVELRFIGYASSARSVTIRENETTTADVALAMDATELGTIVVSAGKFEQKIEEVTVSMDVIKQSLVENKNIGNMEDLMQQCPGVNVMDGQANIRGGSGFSYGAGTRVLILVDDMPLLSGDAGDVKWNFIPVENIEQVEVIKGASSVLFGSSALNGVINFRTSYPKDSARTSASISSGFYDEPKRRILVWWDNAAPFFSRGSFFHARQIKNFDLQAGGSGFSDEGYRQLEKEQRGRFNFGTRYRFQKVKGLSAGINGNFMDTHGGLFLLWQNADSAYRPQGGSLSDYHTQRIALDPFITYFTEKGHRHGLKTRFYETINKNNTNQESTSKVWFGEYQYQLHFKNEFTLTNGLTGCYSEVMSDSLYGRHFSSNAGFFSQADKKFKRLILSFGVRGEYFKVDTAETKARVILGKDTTALPIYPVFRTGLNYRLLPHTWLRASFGQGYRFPSVAEKFISTTVNSLPVLPNPELQPENGWSIEAGARQEYRVFGMRGYVDAAAFVQQYKNMMEFTFGYWNVPKGALIFQIPNYFGAKSINVGRAQIAGVELSTAAEGKIGNVTLTLLGGYTYIRPMDLDYDSAASGGTYHHPETVTDFAHIFNKSKRKVTGNELKYRYDHTAKVDLQAEYKKWSTGISVRYTSFIRNIDRKFEGRMLEEVFPTWEIYILPGLKKYREEHSKGDIIFDYRISYALSKTVKTSMVVNNVFNREYMGRPGDVQAPRNFAFVLGVKI